MRRYLVDFDTAAMKKVYTDVLIIGSGIAGVYTALELGDRYDITVITKEEVEISNSVLAQGGIAVSLDKNDSPEEHMRDTLYAGAGLCDEESVDVLVHEAAANIKRVCNFGVQFDKSENNEKQLALTREGAHSKNRIIHAGDATGKEVCDKLIHTLMQRKNVRIEERIWALDLLVEDNICYGIIAYNEKTGEYTAYYAGIVICASGGYGQLYYYTTNPEVATGDGAAMAYRAGGKLADLEFVQFHPTALYHPGDRPSFLITEAMRGYGGVLRTMDGKEFMQKYDPRLSLAPRDIVARAIDNEMKNRGDDHVYLDVTHKDPEETKKHFPNIYEKCLSLGIDITKDYIPVAPAAHYLCGGILVDLNGQSSIERLYAVGECSCTGLHGGNRLASNSLIEAVVYADAAAKHSLQVIDQYSYNENIPEWNDEGTRSPEEMVLITQSMKEVNQIMSTYVGIVRSDLRLKRAWDRLDIIYEETESLFKRSVASREICELRNMVNVGYLIMRQAMERKESRGLHYTIDYPHAKK